MTTDWMDGMPFIFSIALKLASSIPDAYYKSVLIRDMPDYQLGSDQKETIAAQALECNERVVFIITMLGSILAAAVICLKKQYAGLTVALLTILLIAAVLAIFWMNTNPLGYLGVRVTKKRIPRALFVTIGLILLDVLLGSLSVFLQAPGEASKPGT